MKNIPDELYKEINKVIPIFCLDGILLDKNNKICLFKRNYNPDKDRWTCFGGRLFKGESFEDGIIRKAKEELGINDLKIIKRIGVYNEIDVQKRYEFVCHSVCLAFLVKTEKEIDLSKSSSMEFTQMKEIGNINIKEISCYTQQLINDSGVINHEK